MAKIDMPTSSLNKTPGQQPKKKLEKVTTGKVTVRQQTDIQKVNLAEGEHNYIFVGRVGQLSRIRTTSLW